MSIFKFLNSRTNVQEFIRKGWIAPLEVPPSLFGHLASETSERPRNEAEGFRRERHRSCLIQLLFPVFSLILKQRDATLWSKDERRLSSLQLTSTFHGWDTARELSREISVS